VAQQQLPKDRLVQVGYAGSEAPPPAANGRGRTREYQRDGAETSSPTLNSTSEHNVMGY
jgi:hypothetical protein